MKFTTSLALALPLLALVACASSKADDGASGAAPSVAKKNAVRSTILEASTPFAAAWTPPWSLETSRMRLEPLRPSVAKLDYDGFMSSIEHLRATLKWGGWPSPEFKLEQNEKDLERHWKEFGTGEAFAYTVLTPDRSRCIGCLYVNPSEHDPRAASVSYWVTAAALTDELDTHLLAEVTAWFERAWPLDSAAFPTHVENVRGQAISAEVGLIADPMPEGATRVSWTWKRVS